MKDVGDDAGFGSEVKEECNVWELCVDTGFWGNVNVLDEVVQESRSKMVFQENRWFETRRMMIGMVVKVVI